MSLRKIRDGADAVECLDAAARSGERRAAWARRNGVSPRSLNAWRLNLARGQGGRPAPLRLVELVPRAAGPASRYLVHVGEFRVEVDAGFEDGVLRRLLGVVASC